MLEISCKPISIFLDFNAVIVNLESMEKESRKECLDNIERNMNVLKTYLEKNIALKENDPDIPVTGMAVLYCRPPGFTVLHSFMHLAGALQSGLMLKM